MSALDRTVASRLPSTSGGFLPRRVAAPLSMLAFWAAIALPLGYLPILVAGIDSVSGLALFLGLFALHVLALVGGRSHASATRP